LIRVYIAHKDDPGKRVYVGAITFFVSPTRHDHDTHTLNRMFDITEELRQLGLTGDAQDAIDVQFEVGTGDAGRSRGEVQSEIERGDRRDRVSREDEGVTYSPVVRISLMICFDSSGSSVK
jgi:hypothetical protein